MADIGAPCFECGAIVGAVDAGTDRLAGLVHRVGDGAGAIEADRAVISEDGDELVTFGRGKFDRRGCGHRRQGAKGEGGEDKAGLHDVSSPGG